jgi:hypothetical protein
MRIGWENTRGGYYIKKLLAETDKLADNIGDIVEDVGDISKLTTTAKTDIVSAINELVSRVQALENPATEGGET